MEKNCLIRSWMICTLAKYWGDQVQDSGMGGAYGIYGGKEQFIQGVEEETWWNNTTEEVLVSLLHGICYVWFLWSTFQW